MAGPASRAPVSEATKAKRKGPSNTKAKRGDAGSPEISIAQRANVPPGSSMSPAAAVEREEKEDEREESKKDRRGEKCKALKVNR